MKSTYIFVTDEASDFKLNTLLGIAVLSFCIENKEEEFIKPQHKNITLKRLRQ